MSTRRRAGAESRRTNSSRRSALEEIRRLREIGSDDDNDHQDSVVDNELDSEYPRSRKSRIATFKTTEDSVYKTMTEEEYEDLVRQRRQGLPFVENDDGEMGYYDDGEEQFFESDTEQGIDDEEEPDDKNSSKKRSAGALSSAYIRRAKKLQRAKLGRDPSEQKITNLFFASASSGKSSTGNRDSAMPRSGAGRHHQGSGKVDLDLDSMLDDLTNNPTESSSTYTAPIIYNSSSNLYATKPVSPNSTASFNYTAFPRKEVNSIETDKGDYEIEDSNEAFEHINIDDCQDMDMNSSVEIETENDDQTPHIQDYKPLTLTKREILLQKARSTNLKTTTARVLTGSADDSLVHHENLPTKENSSNFTLGDVPSNEVSEWWNVNDVEEDVGDNAAEKMDMDDNASRSQAKISEQSDSILMYWMDVVEIRDRPGKLYVIGKMKTPESTIENPIFKSVCVVVTNLQRYMYLVPRVLLASERDSEAKQQTWMQIHDEIRHILIPTCITSRVDQEKFQTKLVTRDYAFELQGIPRGKQTYVKLKYPAKYAAPPFQLCTEGGKSFSKICGAYTRNVENFLVKRKLLGPGWVEVRGVRAVKSNDMASYCTYEFETSNPKNVMAIQGSIPGIVTPPLTIMSVGLKTICNPSTGNHEILAISTVTEHTTVSIKNGKMKHSKTLSHSTAIRPLESTELSFPETYKNSVSNDKRFQLPQALRLEVNERSMLSYFATRVQKEDPDVIIGHNLHKYTMDLLISRLDHYKLGGLWSKLTRLRRGRLTPLQSGEGWNEYRMDDVLNGRLLCDTYVSAKELLSSQNNYSLSHLVKGLLQKDRAEVDMADLPAILRNGPSNFVKLLRHTLDDAMFALQLAHHLEVLPLSKQLANLCGYLWTRTLEANKRAERIEFLLLHEFSRSKHKFILPEKFKSKFDADQQASQGSYKKRAKKDASYAGGMVFAPKKGLYDNYVVLLDFNSLYPSIIREYNICFTTVERKLMDDSSASAASKTKKKRVKEEEEDEAMDIDENESQAIYSKDSDDIPQLPSSSCNEGVLPSVIKRLLESRKAVKQELAIATKSGQTEKAKMLDVRQKAIKLTANSMYGCLGFRYSRFYAKSIAALITSTGRQTLQRAKEVAEAECGYDVVYGDTDSIMVDSRSLDLAEAKKIGREIQVQCNKHFRLLELEVDYIFKTILLLNKKKYAALVVKESYNTDGKQTTTVEKEVKGLDMVRRDWCDLSKVVGNTVLDFILSGNSREDVVDSIHEYLESIAANVKAGKVSTDQFVITKSLNKQPEQYPDRAKQYHVQVAIALRTQGKPIGVGSHIPYVLCEQEEPGTGRKAYHPEEVIRSNNKLTIDVNWYLESQLHPPVNRLCAHIEGTSSPQLAHCLGLDTTKFSHQTNILEEEEHTILSVLQDDNDRFQNCTKLEILCQKCQNTSAFPGVYQTVHSETQLETVLSGLQCPSCKADLWGYDQEGIYGNVGDDFAAILSNRLHLAIREATKKYYAGWVVCTDATCKTRTQKQSLRRNGNICSAPDCRANTTMEYSESALYTQLKYFQSLFDITRANKNLKGEELRFTSKSKSAMVTPHSTCHEMIVNKLFKQAEKAVRQNDYNWVKPTIWQSLFT